MSAGSGRPLRIQAVITGMACGGAERQMAMLTSGLADRGHDVGLAVLHGRDSFFEVGPHVDVRFFEIERALDRGRVARFTGRPRWLRQRIRAVGPDVVVSFIDVANVNALWAARGLGVPVVVAERTHPPSHHVRWFERWLRRWLYPRAACLVVQTEATAEWARAGGLGRRVEVIPNAVASPIVGATPPAFEMPDGPVLVSMGRLDPGKRFDLVVDGFAEVAPRHPEWRLVILGDGPERKALEARVAGHGLGGRILIPGTVSDPGHVLARSSLFVLASDYEGFPNALCEAMAHGLAVVATDCPVGPREIVRDGVDGVLVPPGDRGALTGALDRLMDDAATRRRLGREAAAVVERFAPAATIDCWESLLRAVAGGSPW